MKKMKKRKMLRVGLIWGGFAIFALVLAYCNSKFAGRSKETTEVPAQVTVPDQRTFDRALEKVELCPLVATQLPVDASEESTVSSLQIWLKWSHFESGNEYSQTGGDSGHAYGRYQFDDRYSLAGFLQFCMERDESTFVCFQRYVRRDAQGELYLADLSELAQDWKYLCHIESEKFCQLQTEYAMLAYYEPAREMLLQQQGINIDTYSPVLKGTVLSCAIRNGIYERNLKPVWSTFSAGISEAEWLQRIYAAQATLHPEQEQRWAFDQKEAALEALEMLQSGAGLIEAGIEEVRFN